MLDLGIHQDILLLTISGTLLATTSIVCWYKGRRR